MPTLKRKIINGLKFLLEIIWDGIIVILFVIVIRSYIIAPFQIHGPSMCDTFNNLNGQCIRGNGEYIMVYKLGYQNIGGWQIGIPKRGDIVVFQPPNGIGDEFFIKRVIGLPGETIEIKEGYVYINTKRLDESSYLNKSNLGHTDTQKNETIFVIPQGQYFVLGDNRRASSDSRRCFDQIGCTTNNTPFVPLANLQGKAFIVLWPFNQIRFSSK